MPKRKYDSYFTGFNVPNKRYRKGTSSYKRSTGRYYGRRRGFRGGRIMKNAELKWFDSVFAATTVATTGTVLASSLNLIPAGSGESQMIGRKVTLKRVSCQFIIRLPQDFNATQSSLQNSDIVRLFLIQDRQSNGAAATIAQIFQDNDIRGFMELENISRFNILKKWEFILNSVSSYKSTATEGFMSGRLDQYKKYTKKCFIPLEFAPETTPGTRVIAEVKSNNLVIVAISLRGVATVQARMRIRYDDE